MVSRYLQVNSRVMLAAGLIAGIALVDWRVDAPISFGFLYLLPMLLVGTVWRRWQIVGTAAVCTVLADLFDAYRFVWSVTVPQDILAFAALSGLGLFAYEIAARRQREKQHLEEVEQESAARKAAEEQLEFLIDSSPAAILTMDSEFTILRANLAAHRLFGVAPGKLPGRIVHRYIPALARVPSIGPNGQNFRTGMQCRGERDNREVFLASVFFSTYQTPVGPRLAALVVDASEELRDREEFNFEQMLAGSRILMGAVSHEVRNVCGAIAVSYENLARGGMLGGNQDFEALGSLVETLNRIASLDLRHSATDSQAGGEDLGEILDDLRIVLEPYCREADIDVRWDVQESLPPVWVDRHRLLQVLLNLVKNSARALENAAEKRIDVRVSAERGVVAIRVADSGPGIRSPEKLFQPFQKGAESTGLGLYISRAFMRSFRGDLRHDPSAPGCCFVIELAVAGPEGGNHQHAGLHGSNSTAVA
jgi:two-component system, LuxR family, sensor kinase FixL